VVMPGGLVVRAGRIEGMSPAEDLIPVEGAA
jgi:hypothetical protein